MENSDCQKLQGMKIDSQLKFTEHLNGIISKASRKVNALSWITPYMNMAKKHILMNSFFITLQCFLTSLDVS